jgi:hypothetical protein
MQVPRIFLIGLALLILLAACRVSYETQAPPTENPSPIAPALSATASPAPSADLSITGVSVRGNGAQQIVIDGHGQLPGGTCVLTQFSADEMPQAWWPSEQCAEITDGEWRIQVTVDENAPHRLVDDIQYSLIAWMRDDPSIRSEVFWFDLTGPPPE